MHFYHSKSFTKEQEATLRSVADVSFYQENFLTQEEFELCRKLVLSVTDWPEHGKTSKYWGFGIDNGFGPQLTWLLKKVQAIISNFELDFFAVQEAINPWKIHADIRWYEDRIPYKVVLLPMDVEPAGGPVPWDHWPDTATLSFHQRNFLSQWNRPGGPGGLGNNDQSAWVRPIENIQFEGIVPGYHISKETWEQYLTHVPYDHLEGLTIDKINMWLPRSIMCWDNTALHCADNFLAKNIKTKRSLMLFANYRQ